jgi:tetratricopeptide (TPR) repeat protein
VWGGGAGSYNVRFEKFRPERYQDEPQWAHNDYLNTLSDYGAVGFVLFFGAGALLAWRSGRTPAPRRRDWLDDRAIAGALTAGVAAFALQLLVDFHFKIPALAMAFVIVAALLIQRAWQPPRTLARVSLARRLRNFAAAAIVLVVIGGWALPYYRGEALRYAARQSINQMAMDEPARDEQRATLTRARAALHQAVELSPGNAQAWADLSYVSALWFHLEPTRAAELGREGENMANRALAESRIVPEFWVRRGVALDLQGRWSDAGSDFSRALRLAPASANVRTLGGGSGRLLLAS